MSAWLTRAAHTDRMERFEARADAQLDDQNIMLTLSGSSWLLNVNGPPPTGIGDWHKFRRQAPDAGRTSDSGHLQGARSGGVFGTTRCCSPLARISRAGT